MIQNPRLPFALVAAVALLAACQDLTRPASGPELELRDNKGRICPSIPKTTKSIALVPSTLTVAPGTTRQLSLVDQSGATLANCAATWSSSSGLQATVSALGVVSGVSVGQSTISAGIAIGRTRLVATALVTVARPVASVTLSAANTRLLTDSTSQLTVVIKDGSGTTLTGRTVAYTSSDATIATVSATGLVAPLRAGAVTITATSEGVAGSLGFTMYLNPATLGIVYGRGSDLQLHSMRGDGSLVRYIAPGVHPTQVGSTLVARGALNDNNFYTMDPTGANRRLLLGGGPNYVPHFNPTGNRFVHLRGDCGSNNHPIAVTNVDGTGTIVSAQCTTLRPQWAPVSDRIAFGRGNKLYVMGSDFTNVQQVLDVAPLGSFNFESGLAWSPDGTRLLFSARPTGEAAYSLYLVNVDGTGLTRLTPGDGYGDIAFDWSLQGDWLLITSRRTGNDQIWLRSLDGFMSFQLTNATIPEGHDPRFIR